MSAAHVLRRAVGLSAMLLLASLPCLHADIYRWDTGAVVPGTEGITPGPGVQLDHIELEYARLGGWNPGEAMDLTGANFEASNLTIANLSSSTLTNANLAGANLYSSTLTNANLTGANLAGATLPYSTLTNANLTGAVVTGTQFNNTTSLGFTSAQLYSTQSYAAKDLHGIDLWYNNLTGWDFSGQNLTGANLSYSTLTNANLTGAVVTGTQFDNTTSRGLHFGPALLDPELCGEGPPRNQTRSTTSRAGTLADRTSPTPTWFLPRSRTRT